jgi:hypothetical protein
MPEKQINTPTTVIGLTAVQIYEFHDAEDGCTYKWNATEGRRLAEARNAATVAVYPADFGMDKTQILRMYPELDRRKAMALPTVALFSPLLFVEHRGKHVLIDGWHRLYMAVSKGLPCLPAYILTQAEADAIRVNT